MFHTALERTIAKALAAILRHTYRKSLRRPYGLECQYVDGLLFRVVRPGTRMPIELFDRFAN